MKITLKFSILALVLFVVVVDSVLAEPIIETKRGNSCDNDEVLTGGGATCERGAFLRGSPSRSGVATRIPTSVIYPTTTLLDLRCYPDIQ